jgi:membrane associated rhomboid family serine protease
MIVPAPKNLKPLEIFDAYPWTLTILFLNLFFYFILFSQPAPKEAEMTSEFIQRAGHYFLEWDRASQLGHQSVEIQAIGAEAIRDTDFVVAINKDWTSKVDPVGFTSWKKDFDALFAHQEDRPMNIFGLSQIENRPLTWITYQFSHQNGYHVFSNMFLMVFFAAVVEQMVGGLMLGMIYLLGGLMGGLFFMEMDHSGMIPMIGASASVTALMGFVASGSLKKNIEYFFFFSPIPGFFGRIYLSPLWIISIFLLSDITEVISSPPGWESGVAHTAHLGGAFAGLVLGFAYKYGATRVALAETKDN